MSSELAISARGLSKAYQIFARPEDRLKQLLFGKRKQFYREFWALRDVNLEVPRGHTVGIVGRNGSGKSTLLQMICGTLTPTSGELTVRGRIAALLELGAGFNPEFNGRENVFLNAQILGLPRPEIEARFDRIAAFADIGQYIDQPVKTYSSGMYARLAFAVAIHVDPEILVVDEALSVGDEAFQRKCFARIHQIRESGATVLFVSHSAGSVIELCDRAILLDQGEELLTGTPKLVIAKYQKLAYAPADKLAAVRQEIASLYKAGEEAYASTPEPVKPPSDAFDPQLQPQSTFSYESRGARIDDVQIFNGDGEQVNLLHTGREYVYTFRVHFETPAYGIRVGMMVKTISGLELGGIATHFGGEALEFVDAGRFVEVRLPFVCRLATGTYFFNAGVMGVADGELVFLHRLLDVVMVRVQSASGTLMTGLVDITSQNAAQVKVLNTPAATSTLKPLLNTVSET